YFSISPISCGFSAHRKILPVFLCILSDFLDSMEDMSLPLRLILWVVISGVVMRLLAAILYAILEFINIIRWEWDVNAGAHKNARSSKILRLPCLGNRSMGSGLFDH
ncbi:MAG: hypothetical protein FWG61_01205, partial [Firmicutes bacterium]|nr:hypothetical protein [Bacillota bacterium]